MASWPCSWNLSVLLNFAAERVFVIHIDSAGIACSPNSSQVTVWYPFSFLPVGTHILNLTCSLDSKQKKKNDILQRVNGVQSLTSGIIERVQAVKIWWWPWNSQLAAFQPSYGTGALQALSGIFFFSSNSVCNLTETVLFILVVIVEALRLAVLLMA